MSYQRPTLQEIITRVMGDFAARTEGSPYIKKSMERVLCYAEGGVAHGVHGHFEWLSKQLFPQTADIESLLAWGSLIGVGRKAASKSSGPVRYASTSGTIPVGTVVTSVDGTEYVVTVGASASAGNIDVTVEASVEGGDGNLDAGATLTLASPIAGVASTGTVQAPGLIGGAEVEDVEDYRARILAEFREPAAGGVESDYRKWALEVPGVTRAWAYGNRAGVGTVSLAFVRDGDGDIIPGTSEINEVAAYIEERMPLDVRALYVQAPISNPVNITISLNPNTADVRAQVTASLTDLFKSTELETALPLSKVSEAISIAVGENYHSITTISSLTPSSWGILTLGTLTFTSLA